MQYTAADLLVRPRAHPEDPGLLLSITPERAGWDYITFQARRLAAGASWAFETGENELVVVNLTGRYAVASNRDTWREHRRALPAYSRGAAHALYLPRGTQFTLTAEEAGEFAVAWGAHGRGSRTVAHPARRRGDRRAWRRSCNAPDQRSVAAGIAGTPAGAGGGVHAQRQLEQLPAAQA